MSDELKTRIVSGASLGEATVREKIPDVPAADEVSNLASGDQLVRSKKEEPPLLQPHHSRDLQQMNGLQGASSLEETRVAALQQLEQLEGGYTKAHMRRAIELAVQFARTLGVSEAEQKVLRQATLYDIGKMIVPDEILNKKGKPTDEEFDRIKDHVRLEKIGQILDALEIPPPALDIVLYHHERWDGKGYPKGLAGEQIPLLARIVSLTDAYDAMTVKRYNRVDRADAPKAFTPEEAQGKLLENAGKQFDPDLAKGFVEWMRKYPSRQEGQTYYLSGGQPV